MQGFVAQFARAITTAAEKEYWKLQDRIFVAKEERNQTMARGRKHTANSTTIVVAIFNTFRSLYWRCCPALTECSPGILCDLSLKYMMM